MGRVYVYGGLPMGSGSSPGIACCVGTAFIRHLKEKSKHYQGRQLQNMWWNCFTQKTTYNKKLGHGVVLIGDDDLPAALRWSHCDDFLIHGPTLANTHLALTAFMDYAVEVGLLCHPDKLAPPAHVVKCVGFLFDTIGTSTLRIPEVKRVKAIALTQFAVDNRVKISRLSMSVVAGVLESLVEATPSKMGHTHLRALQPHIHPKDWDEDYLPYYLFTELSKPCLIDLLWWLWILRVNKG
jgi:hypothetical protein